MTEPPQCPNDLKDCGNGNSSLNLGKVPCYVVIVSTSLSCVASVVMVLIYLAWKDIRKRGAQSIITFIAIADFFTAFCYLTGCVNILTHYNETDGQKCKVYKTFCDIESYIITLAGMSSFLWTMILAFYFYMITSQRNRCNRNIALKLMPVYHLIGWGIPVLIALPLLCLKKLGYSPFVGGTVWCYIEVFDNFQEMDPFSKKNSEAIIIKLPEMLSYGLILLFYSATVVNIYKKARLRGQTWISGCFKVNKILTLIPVLFIVLRVWGLIIYTYAIKLAKQYPSGCIPTYPNRAVYLTLGIIQAIGGGAQGWVNAILYIFLSPSMRKRLFTNPCRKSQPVDLPEIPSSTYFSPPAIGGGAQGWVNAILYIFLSPNMRKRLFTNPCRKSQPVDLPEIPSSTHFSPPVSSNFNTYTTVF